MIPDDASISTFRGGPEPVELYEVPSFQYLHGDYVGRLGDRRHELAYVMATVHLHCSRTTLEKLIAEPAELSPQIVSAIFTALVTDHTNQKEE